MAISNYPIVRGDKCLMQNRCVNCVLVCPEKAIVTKDKSAFIDYDSCTRCGLCYQVCPTGAIDDPNAMDSMSRAIKLSGENRNIIFVCEKAGFTYNGDNKDAAILHISSISFRTLITIMSKGSPVTMIGCNECKETRHLEKLEEIFARNGYGWVFKISTLPPHEGMGDGCHLDEGLLRELFGSSSDRIPFPGTALVDIGERCTLCQRCARVCPTGALTIEKGDGKLSLVYKHNLCYGCPVCEKVCPERCITIDRRLRLDKVFTKEIKCERGIFYCKGCNKPIVTDAVLDKVRKRLAAHGQSADHLEYCPNCKLKWIGPNTENAAVTFMGRV